MSDPRPLSDRLRERLKTHRVGFPEEPKVDTMRGWSHCGEPCVLGPERGLGGCVNREIRCAVCGALEGTLSTNKALVRRGAK